MNQELATAIPAYVRRARAGDENAMAMLARVGQVARAGKNKRAMQAYAAIQEFIKRNPPQQFTLGAQPAAMIVASEAMRGSRGVGARGSHPHGEIEGTSTALARTGPSGSALTAKERAKPQLPKGIFNTLFDPDKFAVTVIKACGYRNGLPAAAVVLATGPLLTKTAVQQIGLSNFGSDEQSSVFFHGVQNPSEREWSAVAPYLAPGLQRCFAVGQCVGRARKLQAVRRRGSAISDYSEIAGWELGE